MKGGEIMESKRFDISTNELLKSLHDGYDLRTSAAEYILAYEALDDKKLDAFQKSLLNTAEMIIAKEDEEQKRQEGYLFGRHHADNEPTDHVWSDGLQTPLNPENAHAVWPYYQPSSPNAPYRSHHFPFHEVNHPLLRKNAVTGNSQYIEKIRKHIFNGHAQDEKDFEKKFIAHESKANNPLINGYNAETSYGKIKRKLLGSTITKQTMNNHQIDFYHRDYQRWLRENSAIKDDLLSQGLTDDEANREMRHLHFEDRARDWDSNEHVEDENGVRHPKNLGHNGYMYGLEWFSPEERTAIMNHINDPEKGLDKHEVITLPNGEKIPSARITYNALMRMTPEMNWWVRPSHLTGRNAHYRQEDNDIDFEQGGEARFLQKQIGELAHTPQTFFGEKSIADYIIDKIDENYGADKEGQKRLRFLPRLDVHKNPLKELSWDDLKDATNSHFKKKGRKDLSHVRLTAKDLYYLAGFNPDTNDLLENHPIHGKLDEPLVPKQWIDELIQEANHNGSLESKMKDIRNARAFLTSPHGPHPSEEKAPYWKEHKDGYTYGPGKFWAEEFQKVGGVGSTVTTWHEILNATHGNDGDSHLTTLNPESENFVQMNDNNKSLAYHFMPEHTTKIGEYDPVKYMSGEKAIGGFSYNNIPSSIQNMLSPFGTSKVKPHGSYASGFKQGATEKNNHTEHKSSLIPLYEHAIRNMTKNDLQSFLGSYIAPMTHPFTHNPTEHIVSSSGYGPGSSDTHIHKNAQIAHMMNTLLGRLDHPNQPAEKSVMNYKDFLRGDEKFSAGLTLDDFLQLMGWGGIAKPTANALKNRYVQDTETKDALKIITSTAKMLQTTNPNQIMTYLSGGDYEDLKDHMGYGQFDNLDMSSLESFFPSMMNILNEENKKSKEKQKSKSQYKASVTDAIAAALQFGGALPAMEKEEAINDELEDLYGVLNNPELVGEQRQQVLSSVKELEQQLAVEQNKATKAVLGGGSTHYEIMQNHLDTIFKGHRNLVAQVARDVIMPKFLEADPTAFDPNDPQKFIDNNSRLFRDAQRYINTVPHSVHGLTAPNYGIKQNIIERKKSPVGEAHAQIAQHLSDKGTMIDGNMSVNEVLDALGIERSPQAKEHARELIEQSNKLNTPLMASTINQLLTSGAIDKVGNTSFSKLLPNEEIMGKEIEDLDDNEMFHRILHEKGYHQAIQSLQSKYGESQWKGHELHSFPRTMSRLFDGTFAHQQQAAGIGSISNDIHGAETLGAKGKQKASFMTRNHLDTIVHFNPTVNLEGEDGIFTPEISQSYSAGMQEGLPVGAPSPVNNSIADTFDSHAYHSGYEATPSVGVEITEDGQVIPGTNIETGLYHSVPKELSEIVHGNEMVKQVWDNAPPPQYNESAHQSMDLDTYETPSEDVYAVGKSEMSELITSLLNPDVLLEKKDESTWTPPIRPMHRIFSLDDLEHLRGFSGSWVVSKWYSGKRIVIVKNDEGITVYDENGKKKGVNKKTMESIEELNKKNYTIDAILGDEELNIIDIINYDDNNISDMQLFERLKILRSQFDSHESVIVPGPHDTKMTDDEGLEEAVNSLKEEHDVILLRDNKSTYMKGERRHPKWLLYRDTKDFNFIVLDRRGKGPFTYQLGAGPILDGEGLGNRAIEHKGHYYMDVGTAFNQQKAFKVGDIVRASITGVTKKNRKERPVYNIQFKEIEGEGEGEGAASVESLDLLTKSFTPIIMPHDLEIIDDELLIHINDVDIVKYKFEQFEDNWFIHSPKSSLSGIMKNDYPVVLSQSLMPFWSSVAPLMIKGIVTKKTELDMPKKPTEEQMEEESAGLIDEDDENRLLKPETKKKALELILRTLDTISKEKMTWTGPKGLGIDVGTPQESPRGPTKLTEEENLPDFDGEKIITDEKKEKKNERLNHIKLRTDENEEISIDYDNEQPIISHS